MRPLILLAAALMTVGTAQAQQPHRERAMPERNTTGNTGYGKNILAISPMHMTDYSPAGIGISYERVLDSRYRFSFYMPIAFSFSRAYSSGSYPNTPQRYNNSFVYFYPGLKITPFGSNRVFSYSLGPSLAIGFGSRTHNENVYNPNTGNYEYRTFRENINRFGFLINNGLNVQVTPHFYMGLELGLGIRYFDNSDYYYNDDFGPLVQFSFKLGYRF